jgi:hypothetical protein
MTLKDVKEGIIVVKLHTWQIDAESTVTRGWKTVGNEPESRRLRENGREWLEEMKKETDGSRQHYEVDENGERLLMRSYDTPDLPETFIFEYAINGKITTLSKAEFLKTKQQLQRVVETVTLLDDGSFTSEKMDVEVAIRMRGCGRQCTFGVSHIYWA